MQGSKRGHRFLEDHADVVTPNIPYRFFRRFEFGNVDNLTVSVQQDFAINNLARRRRNKAQNRMGCD